MHWRETREGHGELGGGVLEGFDDRARVKGDFDGFLRHGIVGVSSDTRRLVDRSEDVDAIVMICMELEVRVS